MFRSTWYDMTALSWVLRRSVRIVEHRSDLQIESQSRTKMKRFQDFFSSACLFFMAKIFTWNQSQQPHFLTELQQFCTALSTFKKCNYYWLNPVYCKELLDNICFFGVLHSVECSTLVSWWTLSNTVSLSRTIRASLRSNQRLLSNFMGYAALQRIAEILQTQAMKTKTYSICYPKINICHKNRARESQSSQRRFSHAI